MTKGIFCISIDLELLWGRKDLDYSSFVERTKKERGIIKTILQLFKKYQIPATWATVGKLFENGDPLWHGRDLIKLIKVHKNQEIGSHTFSHDIFTKISKEEANRDFKKWIKLAKDNNIKYSSFVFPRNNIAHLEVLKKYKFKSFRGSDRSSGFLKLTQLFMLSPVQLSSPQKIDGLVNIPGSFYFVSARGLRRYIPKNLRFLRVKTAVDSAIKNKKLFHLWFHPVDFADNTKALFEEFEKILEYVDQKRKGGRLEIKNMRQIAKNYL